MKTTSILLSFDPKIETVSGKPFRDGLSSIAVIGETIWVTCDESVSIERLQLQKNGGYGGHTSFRVSDYVSLPVSEEYEIDIEGIDYDGNYLWIVGSHGLKRRKPKSTDKLDKQLLRLAEVEKDDNRYLLACIPVVPDKKGLPTLVKKHILNGSIFRAACMPFKKGTNSLMKALSKDKHFKDFLHIPGKDNGFDIEGLASYKNRLFIGLRGPVLRGWACILEVFVTEKNGVLILDKKTPYHKYFLDLQGMGIRELSFQQDALLILAGPTMDLDGTISVYKWKNALQQSSDCLMQSKDVQLLFDVPHGSGKDRGKDKAEGLAIIDKSVFIVYDSPKNTRLIRNTSVKADVIKLA
ncbi:MAG: DUF3616 domain-containing protein [Cytophagaceae bacterium]|jgi:hypothetical protein|nr:DUF3616 domain-containing protein [Cytophagaceae bacterium]